MANDEGDKRTGAYAGEGVRQGRAVERLRERNLDYASRTAPGRPMAEARPPAGAWKRQTWKLPREQARQKAREFLTRYPRAAYWSEVESWRVLENDIIEFTMRRLPTAD